MKGNQPIGQEQWQLPTTIWNRMFLSIFFVNMAFNLGQQMSNSLLSLYAKSTGAPADQIGQLMSMFAVTALIFRFVAGPAMSAIKRKRLVLMATLLMATAYLGFSFSPAIASALDVNVITVMKCFRLLQGVGNAFGNSCCLTIVADTLPREKFTTGMGYYALAQVVAQSIGPTIGVALRDLVGYNKVYIVFACVMLTAAAATAQMKTAPQELLPFRMNFDNMIAKEALVPACVTLLVAMGFTSINAFMLVYAEEQGIVGASLFFTVYALTMLATRPMVGRLTDRFGFVKVAVPCVLMTTLSLNLIGWSNSLLMLLLAAALNAFGYGAVQPMLQALCMKAVSPERRGSASSTNYIFMDAATIVGPTACGYLAKSLGYKPVMWAAVSVPVLLGAAFIIVFRSRIRRIETDFAQCGA